MTLAQLLASGLVHSQVSRRVASRRLHRVHMAVYSVVPPAALSREGLWHAAGLAAGKGAALSHVSAAELHAVWRFGPRPITLIAPRLRTLQDVTVHRYRRLDPRDVTTERGIRVTTVHRLVVDLSDVCDAHELAAVIHEAAFKGRFVESAIRDAMQRSRGRHNLDVVQRAIALYRNGSAGVRSQGELAFLRLAVTNGFPEPLVNTVLEDVEVDFHWPELRLAVEIDGHGHGRPATRRQDVLEDRVLRAAGYEVVRFSDLQVKQRPAEVLAALSARRPMPSSSCASRPA